MCESETSQEAADLCAVAQAYLCVTGTWERNGGGGGPGPPVPPPQNPLGRTPVLRFFNSSQTATVFCPDGLPFSYTVPAGRFVDSSQLGANIKAQTYALGRANLFRVCLGEITSPCCANAAYTSAIIATGAFVGQENIWAITSGALPPGLSITAVGSQAIISGTPTTPGTYQFTVAFQDFLGDTMSKPYTLRVMGITNAQPFTAGQVGVAYSEFILSAGVSNPIYGLDSGALPDGLALDPTGVIFGTPTVAAVFNFVLSVTEAGTGISCPVNATLEITEVTNCANTPTETNTLNSFIGCGSLAFTTGESFLLVYDGLTPTMDLYNVEDAAFAFIISQSPSFVRGRVTWSAAANEWVDVGTDAGTNLQVHFTSYNKTTLAVEGTANPGSEAAVMGTNQSWALAIRPSTGLCYAMMRIDGSLWTYNSVTRTSGATLGLGGTGEISGSLGVNDAGNRIYLPFGGGTPLLQVRNATTLALVSSFVLPAAQVHGCVYNPDNGLVYVNGNDGGGDGGDVVWVMDPATGVISDTIRLLTSLWAATALTFYPTTSVYNPTSKQIYIYTSLQRFAPPSNGGLQVICTESNTKIAFLSTGADPAFGLFLGDVVYADVLNTSGPTTPTIFMDESLNTFVRGYSFP